MAWAGAVVEDVFSRNFLLILTWLNFLGCGMLSGGALPEAGGAGDCVPPLLEERPDVEDREAGLASLERATGTAPASEAPSVPEVNSLVDLVLEWLASSLSSFSECSTELVSSVLAIDAPRDAGTEGYVKRGNSQGVWVESIDRACRGECTEGMNASKSRGVDCRLRESSQKAHSVGQSQNLSHGQNSVLQSQHCGIRRIQRTPLAMAFDACLSPSFVYLPPHSSLSSSASSTLAASFHPYGTQPSRTRHILMASDAVILDAPSSQPSTSGQRMVMPVSGVKRSFTHLDEGRYEDPRCDDVLSSPLCKGLTRRRAAL